VKTWHDPERRELIVTVLSAVDLEPRVGGQYRNPYAKLFLLPDRRCALTYSLSYSLTE
jgi:regulating synaptic membrane exocytosis protein 2